MFEERVKELIAEFLEERKDIFLIKSSITPDNKIKLVIDGDKGVTLNDCIDLSRQVEHNLDREEVDFSIEVTSPGATEPIVNNRQFLKNVGRKMKVKTQDEKFEGTLLEVAENYIKLGWKAREPKPVGKGKVTVSKEKEISFSDIEEAKVMITF
ncbi:ribosome maturation factor RimP [Zhouia amylolytica]|uniref:Ribosome maturation factor RimP n=2 Tax=Zhouia amylolytica TaxID=376730 RepID=W2UJS0_9FLAO|nr:ribosome assembly cofactor RimP [Zhouia amylolytica]ETN94405.1 hypothetical protein P278_23470 [Zhouia amylolytica AD3]SFT11801.1 ribosome maturation factor RimP [Zhouia amylolytica]